jgi:EmrB/QacA subfamily drug resistance transporter
MPVITDHNRRWWILGAMSGVLGLVVLDETVVGVALAEIRTDLGMSQVASHWVVNAYLLAFTCLVALGGRLGDSLGHRGFFVLGAAIFGLASLAAGLAPAGAWLIGARAVQGIGAAILFPSSWAMMTTIFPPTERGFAFGIQTTIAGIFMSSGPLVGGFFAEVVSWRWIFWINLPIVAVIGWVVLAAWIPSPEERRRATSTGPGSFDGLGLITLVVGLIALVVALMEGAEWGWDATATLALAGGGIVLLVVFTVTETRRVRPLIELDLLRIPTFTGGNLVFFVFQFDKIVIFVFVALYLQDVLHETPIEAGLAILTAIVPTLFTSLLAGRSADRFGSRGPLMVGLLLNASALIVVGFGAVQQSYSLVVLPLVIWGATLPFLSVCPRRALMGAVPSTKQGQASGVNLTIQMLGGTIGMALCGTLLASTGDFGLVFLVTAAVVLATLPIAWSTIERHGAPAAA